jgi:predicted RND superfamily exporter protein
MRVYEAWSSAYFNWIVRHPVVVIVVAVLATLACALGMRNLAFDPDSRVFFGQNNPQKAALDRMERTFSAANNVVFVVAAKQGTVFTTRGLALIEALTERSWKTPYSSRVDSISNVQASSARGDEIVFEPYFKSAARVSEGELPRIARAVLGDKELVNRVISPRGDATAIVVFVVQPRKDRQEIRDVAAFARATADEFRSRYPEFEIRLTGGVLADVTFAEAGSSDRGCGCCSASSVPSRASSHRSPRVCSRCRCPARACSGMPRS